MLIMDAAAVKSAYRASRCTRRSRNGVLYED